MWSYRPDERRRTPGPEPGVCVTCGGRRYFFPGSTAELALMLARSALDLDAPGTAVEWGERENGCWSNLKWIKGAPPPESPSRGV